jgi:hypothetical protein
MLLPHSLHALSINTSNTKLKIMSCNKMRNDPISLSLTPFPISSAYREAAAKAE